jgi:RNA polymerase sigma factor (sigma-70 family)
MSQDQNRIKQFEEMILPHLNAAYNLARWIMNNDQDAEDMVQEAYLRAYKYFVSFQGTNSRAWLLTIVRNTCYTWLKENRSKELTVELQDEMVDVEDEPFNAESLFQRRNNRNILRRAIEQLPLEFREVIILRDLEDLAYKEIAQIAGIPIGTVMSRLARAHLRLKQGLMNLIEEEGVNEL